MKIDGYEFAFTCSAHEAAILMVAAQDEEVDLQPIFGNDAMWHYMTTGQVLEGQNNGRTTDTGNTEEGTDH